MNVLTDALTTQQIFDLSVVNFSNMKKRCSDYDGSCRYRNKEGNSCIIGKMLTDKEAKYFDSGYATGINSVISNGDLPSRLRGHEAVLVSLQLVHDDMNSWGYHEFHDTGVQKLRGVAKTYDLDDTQINKSFSEDVFV